MQPSRNILSNKRTLVVTAILFLVISVGSQKSQAQVSPCNCSANVGSGNVNFSSLTWTGTGCPTSGSTSYTGNLCVDLVNGSNLIMNKDFTISGGFKISNGGNSTFTLPAGFNLTVGGNMGDNTNNNVMFTINGNLNVGGTIYGKNSNAFSGSGNVTATGLNFNQPPTCAPCDINWDVDNCVPASAFCTVVLPITLLFFDVEEHPDFVRLTWATVSELNFDKFMIERTLDGKEFFEIGNVKGSGTSTTRIDYGFDDKSPIVGRSYYRLKAVDYDGKYEYFGLDVSNFSGSRSMVIYPNPSSGDHVKLLINFSPEEESQIEIFNSFGIKLDQITISQSITHVKLPSGLKPGFYFIRFRSVSFSQTLRFYII